MPHVGEMERLIVIQALTVAPPSFLMISIKIPVSFEFQSCPKHTHNKIVSQKQEPNAARNEEFKVLTFVPTLAALESQSYS